MWAYLNEHFIDLFSIYLNVSFCKFDCRSVNSFNSCHLLAVYLLQILFATGPPTCRPGNKEFDQFN